MFPADINVTCQVMKFYFNNANIITYLKSLAHVISFYQLTTERLYQMKAQRQSDIHNLFNLLCDLVMGLCLSFCTRI